MSFSLELREINDHVEGIAFLDNFDKLLSMWEIFIGIWTKVTVGFWQNLSLLPQEISSTVRSHLSISTRIILWCTFLMSASIGSALGSKCNSTITYQLENESKIPSEHVMCWYEWVGFSCYENIHVWMRGVTFKPMLPPHTQYCQSDPSWVRHKFTMHVTKWYLRIEKKII